MSVGFDIGLWSLEIYIGKFLEISDTDLKFEGHFRIPEKFLPVRHILEICDRKLLVRITKKEELQDTSTRFYDEGEQGMICLSPSAIIRVHYEVIRGLKTEEQFWAAVEEIANEMNEMDKCRGADAGTTPCPHNGAEIAPNFLKETTRDPNQDTCSQSCPRVD